MSYLRQIPEAYDLEVTRAAQIYILRFDRNWGEHSIGNPVLFADDTFRIYREVMKEPRSIGTPFRAVSNGYDASL